MTSLSLQPGTVVDRFRVEAVLGRGGMATVYRARHAHLDTLHALKVLHVASLDIHRRLLVEGRAQANLRHRHVVAVSDVVQVGNHLGLVMEYVAGPTLRVLLDRYPPAPAAAWALGVGILDGVVAAHAAGVVHRDLKPGNILLALEDGGVVPKITDFGLAKMLDADAIPHGTRSGATMGTPAYMAPEQVRDAKDVDHRADVFALGSILYELLAHAPAFDGPDDFEVMLSVTSGRRVPLAERRPGLPPALVAAVESALVVDREARTPTVAALAAAWRAAWSPPPQVVWPEDVIDALRHTIPGVELGEGPSVLPSSARSSGARLGGARPTIVDVSEATEATPTYVFDGESVQVPAVRAGDSLSDVPRRLPGWLPLLALGLGAVAVGGLGLWLGSPEGAPVVPAPPVVAAPAAVAVPTPVDVAPTDLVASPPTQSGPAAVSPSAAPAPSPTRSSPLPAARPASPAASPAPAPTPALEVVAPPVSAPAPAPAPPPAAPVAPVADGLAAVAVRGFSGRVWLSSAGGRFVAGRTRVPPGHYVVTAMFPASGDTGLRVLELDVAEGETITLDCDEGTLRCTVSR